MDDESEEGCNCEICGGDDSVMYCASCSNERVCLDCISQCGDFCKDCEHEAVFYNEVTGEFLMRKISALKPVGVIKLGDL